MATLPCYKVVLFVEPQATEADARFLYLWSAPRVGDILTCELTEDAFEVTRVFTKVFSYTLGRQGAAPAEEPDHHFDVHARRWRNPD